MDIRSSNRLYLSLTSHVWLPPALSLLASMLYVYSVYPYGLGVTDDSVNYFSAALSFPPSLQKVDGSPFVEWPPLYPLLLSLFKYTGLSPVLFAFGLHLLSLQLSFWIIGSLIVKDVYSFSIRIWAAILSLFSLPVLLVYAFAWSEAFFTTLVLLIVYQLKIYNKRPSLRTFIIITILSVLLCFQRKSGIVITSAISLYLLSFPHESGHRKRILTAANYFLLSILPFLLYLIARYTSSGRFVTEQNELSLKSVLNNLSETINVVSTWVIPDELPFSIRLSFCLLILFFAITICFFLFRRIRLSPYHCCLLTILAGYLIFTNIIFLFLKLDDHLDDRIFAPVYPVFLLLLSSGADFLYTNRHRFNHYTYPLIIIGSLWLTYPISRTIYHLYKWHTTGVGGYSNKLWKNHAIINWIQQHQPDQRIRTNQIFPVFYYSAITGKNRYTNFDLQDSENKPYLYIGFDSDVPEPGKASLIFKSGNDHIYYIAPEN